MADQRRMKYVSLCVLSLQTAAHVVLTRYSRANQETSKYLASTVVSLVEALKLLTCIIVIICSCGTYIGLYLAINSNVFEKWMVSAHLWDQ